MLGQSHYQIAAASWVGVLTVADQLGAPITGPTAVLSLCAAAAAGVAPDIDHPGSSVTKNFGPVGKLVHWLVRRTLGAHRGVTHSIGGVAWAGVVAGAALLHPYALAVLLGVLVATALDVVSWVREGFEWVAAALVAFGSLSLHAPWLWLWLPLAVAWGWHAHLLCDRMTKQPIPYRWPLAPLSERTAWSLFRTGSRGETITVAVVWLAVGALFVFRDRIGLGLLAPSSLRDLGGAVADPLTGSLRELVRAVA